MAARDRDRIATRQKKPARAKTPVSRCRVAHADKPGEYCFPPVASLITSAARLMLALLERAVSVEGGTYAMEDTDSIHTARRLSAFNSSRRMRLIRDGGSRLDGLIATRATRIESAPPVTTESEDPLG